MTDKQILETLRNIATMCAVKTFAVDEYGYPVINTCAGCKFYTVKANHEEKWHCQLSALFGNLSANPLRWDMALIEEIMDEID